jgi:hypothetical protein
MMTPRTLLALAFVTAALSCDSNGADSQLGQATGDCPIGTFKPEGLDECVFPAEDAFGQTATVTDNRCATGQPAHAPACVSDTGRRAYYTLSKTCAPNYHYSPGVCQRLNVGGNTGEAGFCFGCAGSTGVGGFFTAGFTGSAGAAGFPETGETGFGGSTSFPGSSGGGASGGSGAGGASGGSGADGESPDAAATDAAATDGGPS